MKQLKPGVNLKALATAFLFTACTLAGNLASTGNTGLYVQHQGNGTHGT